MVEEIITALSRIRWLFVIARNSSFTYKGQAVDVKRVGCELGVRYVLEGSVRKAGGRVRITAQLIDATNDAHLWADRFDGSLEDIFELQDNVASSVAGVIEPALQAAEIRRSAERPTSDLTVYDLYLRALPLYDSYDTERMSHALDLLGRAIDRDERYGPALALAAGCHLQLDVNEGGTDRQAHRREAVALARRALGAAGDDPGVLGFAAHALGYFGEEIDAAIRLIDRALTLSPSFARGWRLSGWLRLHAGNTDAAIEHTETSLRLSPRDPTRSRSLVVIGIALFINRRFGDAAASLLVALEDTPSWAMPYRVFAASYAHMGPLDDARAIIKRLRSITSAVVPSFLPFRNPEHRELLLSGLRVAAGEVARDGPTASRRRDLKSRVTGAGDERK